MRIATQGTVKRADLYADVTWFGASASKTGTENRTIIQAVLDAYDTVSFGKTRETFSVTGALTLRDGHRLRFDGATLTQTQSNTQIFNLDAKTGIDVEGGIFHGVGTDFTNVGGLRSAFRGVLCGTVKIRHCEFYDFADTALTCTGATSVSFLDNYVRGPGSSILTAVTSGTCGGVLIGNDCENVVIRGNEIEETSQGVSTGDGIAGCVIANNNVHDIIGQHGIYCGGGHTGLSIANNNIRQVSLQGIKVQNYDASALYADDITIAGNTIASCGSHGISALSTTAAAVYKLRNVTITGNTITSAGEDGMNLAALVGANISSNVIRLTTRDGIRISESQDSDIGNNVIRSAGNNGIRELLACTNCSAVNNRIFDPARNNTTNEEHGIYIPTGSSWVVDDNIIRDSTGAMRYGLFMATASQASCIVRRNVATGASDYGARFYATGTNMVAYADNIFSGTSGAVLNDPTTDQRGNRAREFYGTAAPSSGTWLRGDVVWNSTPSAAGVPGWVCTTAGTPGTWKAMAALAA